MRPIWGTTGTARPCTERTNPPLIRVHCEWDGWQTVIVRFNNLRDLHWFQPIRAPHPLVHAHVSCTDLVRGIIPHDCGFSVAPQLLCVCVLKRHTIPTVYEELARRADERRASIARNRVSWRDKRNPRPPSVTLFNRIRQTQAAAAGLAF